jgi:hypothetical protein
MECPRFLSARRHAQGTAGIGGTAGDLHLRTHQSRQGAGIHDSGHAPDRRRLSRGHVYLIVGATHPQVKRQEGEVYRESLVEMAGIWAWRRTCVSSTSTWRLDDLLAHLQACDVYVTPYPGKDQIASGTLAYALAAGGAVVSTPTSTPRSPGRRAGPAGALWRKRCHGGCHAAIPDGHRIPDGNAAPSLPVRKAHVLAERRPAVPGLLRPRRLGRRNGGRPRLPQGLVTPSGECELVQLVRGGR